MQATVLAFTSACTGLPARAETVDVKYVGPVRLDNFECQSAE